MTTSELHTIHSAISQYLRQERAMKERILYVHPTKVRLLRQIDDAIAALDALRDFIEPYTERESRQAALFSTPKGAY